ncbi:MAG: hypothetical protein IJ086_00070 [Clostridium sp.]|nr:hypothetical protein [Clostridium sp.]
MIVRFGKNKKNKANRLINLLFNVQEMIDKNDLTIVNDETLTNIIKMSYNKSEPYEIIFADDFDDGQFITIENHDEVRYICFSYEQPCDTRNGYFLTKIVVPLRKFVNDISNNIDNKKRTFELFLLDVEKNIYEKHKGTNNSYNFNDLRINNLQSSSTICPYNSFAYRLFKTCEFRIVNESSLPFDIYIKNSKQGTKTYKEYIDNKALLKKPFKTIDDLETARNSISKDNTANSSSYFLIGDKIVTIYGKTFGNNGFEVIPISYCIYLLARKDGKEVIFYQVKDGKEPKPISKDNIKFMESLGIKVYDELQDYEENPNAIIDDKQDSRYQAEFKKNLLLKYGSNRKCYLCDCTIPENLIASHIQRVCDINKLSIPFAQRRAKAVDGNNGFWLCANHDKMFEYGIITFNEHTGTFVLGQDYLNNEKLTPEQECFIKEITKESQINKEHFTTELQEYLKIHNERIRNENNK